jgi:hypothetical protein
MANNLSGISYTNNFNNLDGLSIVQADELFIDGTSIDPTNLVPYTGASQTTDLGSQNIKTTRLPTANADLTNKLYVDSAVSTGSGDTLGIVNLNFVRYSGSISDTDLGTYKISSSAVPTTTNNLTNKNYVDAGLGTKVPYTGAVYDLDLGSQDLSAAIVTGTQIMLSGTAPTPARVAGYDTTGLYYLTTPATYLTNLSSDPQTQLNGKGGLTSNNSWSGTNSFSNTVSLTSVATATATYTLGINASNQIVKYTPSSGIGGSVTTGYIPYASASNTLADSVLFQSGTRIGIGLTNPAYKLDVNGETHTVGILTIGNASTPTNGLIRMVTSNGDNYIQSGLTFTSGSSANLIFGSIYAGNEWMRISSTGNVGIGVNTPNQKLHVSGDGARIQVESNTANNAVVQLKTNANISYLFTDQSGHLQIYPGNGGLRTNICSNGYVGLGKNSAGLCTVESQTSTLTAYSSFYITPGPATTFFPVVFNTNAAHDTGQNTWKITVARTSVHQDATWRGSLMAEFWGNSSVWGNGADSFSYQIAGTTSGATYNYFVGNAAVDFTSGWLVVYLRGGTTYQYSCKGASLYYYPSSSPFVSYTIPAGNNSVVYATNTVTVPFDNTYVQYDGVSGLTNFGSSNAGQYSSRLNNRIGGGVELYGTNGGFSAWAATPASGFAKYTNSIYNGVNVTTYNISSWDSQGYTVFCNTSIPSVNQPGLGLGTTNYGACYITSLAPGLRWMDLVLSSSYTYMYCLGVLSGYFTNGGYVNVSDEREKEDIKDLKTTRSLQRILACIPKFYKRKIYEKEDGTPVSQSTKETVHIGLLAQDVLQHNPHCVSTWENTQTDDEDKSRYGINYGDYTVHLIGAVQELSKTVTSSASQIQEQQKQIDLLLRQGQEAQLAYDDLKKQLMQSQQDLEDYKALTEERFNKLVALIQK